jgi:2-polyprenyl-6-methoxyphenol hydroxylase-like FAD-dependent oxidoreductase
MTVANRLIAAVASAVLSLAAGISRAAPHSGATDSQTPVESSAWQQQHAEFNFFGTTSLYTCDGLESKVRQMLLFVGARNDLKVRAVGCTRGPDAPTHAIWAIADFYSLVAIASAPTPTVPARWTRLRLEAQRPDFMGRGDCELIDGMKQVLSQHFSWRGLDLLVNCVPHELSLNDFHVEGEVLKAVGPS